MSEKILQGYYNLKYVMKKDPIIFFTLSGIVMIVLIFIFYPIYRVIVRSLIINGEFSVEEYFRIITTPRLRRAFTNSMILGVSVATTTTITGFLAAFSLTKITLPGRSIFSKLVMMPLISPPFMLSIAIIFLLGRRGFITYDLLGLMEYNVYGLDGLILVQTLYLTPIAYRTIAGVLSRISTNLEHAAMNLGAGKFKVFKTITLPLALPGIASAWLLSFVLSIADFANPMVIGEGFNVLSVEAYIQITGRYNFARGAAFAVLLLIPAFSAFIIQNYWISKKSYVTVTGKPTGTRKEMVTSWAKVLLFLFLCIFSFVTLLFYGVVILAAFVETWGVDYSFTLDHFASTISVTSTTIQRTIFMAATSAPISALMGMIIAFIIVRKKVVGKEILHFSSIIPFAIPGTVVGIGYVLAFNTGWIVLTGTASIIIILLAIRNMPVGLESGVSTLKQIDPSISEASLDLGANTAQTFTKISLPLLKPAILSGLSYSFVRGMTAVSAIIFVVSARWNHLTMAILQRTELMQLGAASVLCLFLIVFIMSVFALLQKFLGEKSPATSEDLIT